MTITVAPGLDGDGATLWPGERDSNDSDSNPASVWQATAGGQIADSLLAWPPDVFALTDALLERSESYRFARALRSAAVPGDRECVSCR